MDKDINLSQRIASFLQDGTKKMNLKGTLVNMPIYKIPLDFLYYNDQNDRIATWISKYERENNKISDLGRNEYNLTIQDYIIKADTQRFKNTLNNIRNFTQLEAGVVADDGRVIDGNRRFSCLRKLFEETGDQSFNYFRAVILPETISEKEIKQMELVLQHGQEGKVDYNPIEKLVGIYRDVVKKGLFTVKEYATSIDSPVKDVQESIEKAKLMADFLDYIHAPEQFYIARELEIDGPLGEIFNIKKRIGKDEEKWEKVRIALFDNMLMKTNNDDSGDITRIIREFGKRIVSNDILFEKYFTKHDPLSRDLNSKLQKTTNISTDYIRKEIRDNTELKQKMQNNLEGSLYEAKKDFARKQPLELLSAAIDDIEKIDLIAVARLQNEDREEFRKNLEIIQEKIKAIESNFNETL